LFVIQNFKNAEEKWQGGERGKMCSIFVLLLDWWILNIGTLVWKEGDGTFHCSAYPACNLTPFSSWIEGAF
jgi:hypothetical protein